MISTTTASSSSQLLYPIIRKLDYTALTQSHEATHEELAKTVDELAKWLSLVEVGLSGLLGPGGDEVNIVNGGEGMLMGTTTIEEEKDDLLSDEGTGETLGGSGGGVGTVLAAI